MNSRADIAAQRLRRLIRGGYFAPDEPLPTLGELTDIFKLSRVTIQSAIHQLRKEGLVRATRGQGVFVNYPLTWKSKGKTIALVTKYPVKRLDDPPYPAHVIRALKQELARHGYELKHISLRDIGLQDLRAALTRHALAGVIMFEVEQGSWVDDLKDLFLPLVSVDFDLYHLGVPSVTFDNLGAGFQATKYLLSKGHRNIAFLRPRWQRRFLQSVLGRSVDIETVEYDRMRGYELAMSDAGLEPAVCELKQTDLTESVQEMFAQRKAPTAVLSMGTDFASEVVGEIQGLGYEVPRDVSFMTFGEARLNRSKRLTGMGLDLRGMGKAAAQLWLEALEGAPPRRVVLPCEVREHGSVTEARPHRAGRPAGAKA
jgi:DNA-binding LacI/PurR family transcriptional regulator